MNTSFYELMKNSIRVMEVETIDELGMHKQFTEYGKCTEKDYPVEGIFEVAKQLVSGITSESQEVSVYVVAVCINGCMELLCHDGTKVPYVFNAELVGTSRYLVDLFSNEMTYEEEIPEKYDFQYGDQELGDWECYDHEKHRYDDFYKRSDDICVEDTVCYCGRNYYQIKKGSVA